jgi:hypothetical protein
MCESIRPEEQAGVHGRPRAGDAAPEELGEMMTVFPAFNGIQGIVDNLLITLDFSQPFL